VLHSLISAQESPVPLPKFQMAPRFKILMSSGSKKGTIFTQKFPASESPPGSAYGERYPLTGHSYVFLNISLFIFPSESPVMFPNRVPTDRDTPSPEPLVYLFILSFIYVCRSPQKGALLHMRKNIWSPSTEPHADERPTYSTMGCGLVPQGDR
jgi:hypothetical protein